MDGVYSWKENVPFSLSMQPGRYRPTAKYSLLEVLSGPSGICGRDGQVMFRVRTSNWSLCLQILPNVCDDLREAESFWGVEAFITEVQAWSSSN